MAKKYSFCPKCFDRKKATCTECRLIKLDRQRERTLFLGELWTKAHKFNMKSFSNDVESGQAIDDEVIEMFGPWKRKK